MPDIQMDATATIATSPSRGWLGWALCATTGAWYDAHTASHQRGNRLQRRAARDAKLQADKKARDERKQEYDAKAKRVPAVALLLLVHISLQICLHVLSPLSQGVTGRAFLQAMPLPPLGSTFGSPLAAVVFS